MGILHVVATPIGNLEDVTLRALRVLREADVILAEDTRRTRVLLDRHGIAGRPRSLYAHNEAARAREVLAALRAGRRVALVSDAGTPLVSDPGERLVAAAVADGHAVVPVPGPSAVLAALCAAGLATDTFSVAGFLPRRAAERRRRLVALAGRPETLVLFESPRRLGATLRELVAAFGDRPACVGRELTKLHEELVRGTLSELAERFAAGTRGEVTLVVAGAAPDAASRAQPGAQRAAGERSRTGTQRAEDERSAELDAEIRRLIRAGRSAREIVSALGATSALPRRELYHRVVSARESS